MDVSEAALLALRVAHALAALVWVGGGVYYLAAIVPARRQGTATDDTFVGRAQGYYSEWAQPATIILLATGIVMTFDRLSAGSGGLTYVGLLAVKIGAAIAAFALVAGRRRGRRSRVEVVVILGLSAYVLGVLLSSIWT